MTDDELQERLRRLAARPDADWEAMAAAVRDGYAREQRRRPAAWRRRFAAAGGTLAMAAALTLWVRAHHHRHTVAPVEDEAGMFDDADPDELIDELTPAQLDSVSEALKKGA